MYKTEVLKPTQLKMPTAELKNWEKHNEDLCDTAGFVPLAVRMQRMIEAGQIAQFTEDDFDVNDYRQMYLSPEMKINPDDDLEDIQDKLELRRQYQAAVVAERSKSNNANPDNNSTSKVNSDVDKKSEVKDNKDPTINNKSEE